MYEKLKKLSENKAKHFHENVDPSGWYKWSAKYFEELPQEIAEALNESRDDNTVYLEDELGDVFWDYLMLLNTLKLEWKITSVDMVLERAYNKFSERVGKDWNKVLLDQSEWKEIKNNQKVKRKQEHEEKYGK